MDESLCYLESKFRLCSRFVTQMPEAFQQHKRAGIEGVKGAAARGLLNVKGHRLTGGMRASLYNAMPLEGAKALADYMKAFEVEHHV